VATLWALPAWHDRLTHVPGPSGLRWPGQPGDLNHALHVAISVAPQLWQSDSCLRPGRLSAAPGTHLCWQQSLAGASHAPCACGSRKAGGAHPRACRWSAPSCMQVAHILMRTPPAFHILGTSGCAPHLLFTSWAHPDAHPTCFSHPEHILMRTPPPFHILCTS